MEFEIDGEIINLDIFKADSHHSIASKFISHTAVKEKLTKIANDFYYAAYPDPDQGGASDTLINKIAGAYLEGGIDKVQEVIFDEELFQSTSDTIFYSGNSNFSDDISTNFYEAYLQKFGLTDSQELSHLRNLIDDYVRDEVVQLMEDGDTSVFTDLFSSHDTIRLSYIEGRGQYGCIDDISTHHNDVCSESTTILADINTMLLFKLLNVSPLKFVDYMREERNVDLLNPEISDSLTETSKKSYRENAQAWRFICAIDGGEYIEDNFDYPYWLSSDDEQVTLASLVRQTHDDTRKPVVSMKDLVTILDNSSYGGVGTLYFRVNVKSLLKGELDNQFLAKGGQIGLHDFINGSGYLSDVTNEVLIDPSSGSITTDDSFGYAPESVYGFVQSYLDVNIKPFESDNNDLKMYKPGSWRCVFDNDKMATVQLEETEEGIEVYRLTTHSADGREITPHEHSSPFSSLSEVVSKIEEIKKSDFVFKDDSNPVSMSM